MKRLLLVLSLLSSGGAFGAGLIMDTAFVGYAGVLSASAENEVFFNVGAMNGRIAAMQARIEQLERELAEAKAKR